MIPTVLAVLAALAGPVPDRVPEAVRAGTPRAVARIRAGAEIRAVWIEGKFGEYGDRVHVIRFNAAGDPTAVEGKFIRLGDDRFRFSPAPWGWHVTGKFGDGGGPGFEVHLDAARSIREVRGRFYHYGDEVFRFVRDGDGRLVRVEGKFGRDGTPGFTFGYDEQGRITAVIGKFLTFGDERFVVRYYPGTRLPLELRGKFARWGDDRFGFYYEAW
ncbi:hypothetical protein [Deferrisoma palaeochoriense]